MHARCMFANARSARPTHRRQPSRSSRASPTSPAGPGLNYYPATRGKAPSPRSCPGALPSSRAPSCPCSSTTGPTGAARASVRCRRRAATARRAFRQGRHRARPAGQRAAPHPQHPDDGVVPPWAGSDSPQRRDAGNRDRRLGERPVALKASRPLMHAKVTACDQTVLQGLNSPMRRSKR